MTRTRDEVLADLQPIRQDMQRISEHLSNAHGVRPEPIVTASGARGPGEITDPAEMDEVTLVRWARVYMGLGLGDIDPENDEATLDVDRLRELAEARQSLCDIDGCLGLAKLMEIYAAAREERDELRAELPAPKPGGPAQTVRPASLDVAAMTGLAGRYGGE